MAKAEKFNTGQEVRLQIPARGSYASQNGHPSGSFATWRVCLLRRPSGHGHATNNAPHIVSDTIVSAATPNIVSQKRSIGARVSVGGGVSY